jgi:2-oxoglutarate ferredoxin oxidoreductase subunit alpha
MFGRNGESPVIVIAASTPANCYDFAYAASKLALEHMTPVILLTDGYIANGSAPWKIQPVSEMPDITPRIIYGADSQWRSYDRDKDTLARDWAIPGTKGLEHRIGGLEKDKTTGEVSYDPENHQYMTEIRAEKIKRVQNEIPELQPRFAQKGELLVVGWGGTFGTLYAAVKEMKQQGFEGIGLAHFNYINPLPRNTAEVLQNFKKIVVCELNSGQFASLLRMNFENIPFFQFNKVQGLPFGNVELTEKFKELLA